MRIHKQDPTFLLIDAHTDATQLIDIVKTWGFPGTDAFEAKAVASMRKWVFTFRDSLLEWDHTYQLERTTFDGMTSYTVTNDVDGFFAQFVYIARTAVFLGLRFAENYEVVHVVTPHATFKKACQDGWFLPRI